MELVAIVAAVVLLLAGTGLAVSAGRKHRNERHEVESFFGTDRRDQAWWDERQ